MIVNSVVIVTSLMILTFSSVLCRDTHGDIPTTCDLLRWTFLRLKSMQALHCAQNRDHTILQYTLDVVIVVALLVRLYFPWNNLPRYAFSNCSIYARHEYGLFIRAPLAETQSVTVVRIGKGQKYLLQTPLLVSYGRCALALDLHITCRRISLSRTALCIVREPLIDARMTYQYSVFSKYKKLSVELLFQLHVLYSPFQSFNNFSNGSKDVYR